MALIVLALFTLFFLILIYNDRKDKEKRVTEGATTMTEKYGSILDDCKNLHPDQVSLIEADGKHTYEIALPGGDPIQVPSVTTVMDCIAKPALVPWAYSVGLKFDETGKTHKQESQEAMARGTKAHAAFEEISKGNLDPYVEQDIRGYVDTFRQWVKAYDPMFLAAEVKVGDPLLGYAGTLDAIVMIRKHPPRARHEDFTGKIGVIDYKTNKNGKVYPDTHIPQVKGYREALSYMGLQVDFAAVAAFGPDGERQFCPSYGPKDTFAAIKGAYDALNAQRNANPNKRKNH